jgi:hypothetical protein
VSRQLGGSATLHHFAIAQQRYAPLIFEIDGLDRVKVVQQAETVLEALRRREKRRREAEMPFADAGGRVTVRLEQFCTGQLVGMDAALESALHPFTHPGGNSRSSPGAGRAATAAAA